MKYHFAGYKFENMKYYCSVRVFSFDLNRAREPAGTNSLGRILYALIIQTKNEF